MRSRLVRCENGVTSLSRYPPATAPAKRTKKKSTQSSEVCSWRGKACDLVRHHETCRYQPVDCKNAGMGCKKSVLRKDAARHASKICAYRDISCAHCQGIFTAHALREHKGRCPEELLECPNAGCGVTAARRSMGEEHRDVCDFEEVECPCPGCEEMMVRGEVDEHVEASGAEHMWRAWEKMAEMEDTVTELKETVSELVETVAATEVKRGELEETVEVTEERVVDTEEKVAELEEIVAESRGVILGLQKALTRVFTWCTDSVESQEESNSYEFCDGVEGYCFNCEGFREGGTHFMGFCLKEGPVCTMHYK